ncbi:MAG: efflux RND transporter permease subunit, partial [Deltaproteobacteria bacterium]|nr:efflux RND transporter permease subunit [Deltaproteobacteria bacterium]
MSSEQAESEAERRSAQETDARETDESPQAKGPLSWMANNHVAANVLMLVLLVGGLVLAGRIKQEVFPEVEMGMVVINVPYPGASPSEVEQGVLLSVEESVRGIDGVKEVRGTASEGQGVVTVELLLDTNSDRALSDVKSAVDRITSFPEDVEKPVISLASNRRQVMSLVVHGDRSEAELRAVAEELRQGLLQQHDITYVELSAIRPLEIDVEIPQRNLREHGLTLEQVAARIRQASVDVPGGTVRTAAGEVLLRTTERRDRGSEFGDIVLRAEPDGSLLRVRDLGQVLDGFAETDQEAYFNGERAALINIFRVGDETPTGVSAAVKSYLREHRADLPEGLDATIWHDRSDMFRERVDLLRRNAILGLTLVLLVLGLFLEPKLAFWVTLGIPISFAGSLLFLPAADVSINMISLFAFIVTLGMVVDDAIVVGEAVHHHRMEGESRLHAAIAGVREVSIPVIFSVLTTCVAFMPLLFVPGVMGKFFRVIPIVVISVLLISLVESLAVLPAHLSRPMPRWLAILLSPLLLPLGLLHGERLDRGIEWFIHTVYGKSLELALRWRYATIAVAVATLVGTLGVVAGGRLQFTFMPKIESDVVSASLRMPVGTPVAVTRRIEERLQREAAEILHELSPDSDPTRGTFVELGSSTSLGGGPVAGGTRVGGHLASVVVYLLPIDDRSFSARDFAQRWRERVGEVAGAETLTFNFSTGASSGKPIDLRLMHPDPATLEAAATRLATELHEYAGVTDIDSGVSLGKEQLDLELRPEALARGLTETDVARQLRAAFFGAEATRQQRGRDE